MYNVTSPSATSLQSRLFAWVKRTFGMEIAMSRKERAARVMEEASELVQACDLPYEEALYYLNRAYSREKGEVPQEAAGLVHTVAALCSAYDIDMIAVTEAELARVEPLSDRIREKNLQKKKDYAKAKEEDDIPLVTEYPANPTIGQQVRLLDIHTTSVRRMVYTGEVRGQGIWVLVREAFGDIRAEGDNLRVLQQIQEFVNGRPVKLLTRRANSKRDSHVAYETTFPQVRDGVLQIFMRCEDGKVIAAVNVSEMEKKFDDFWTKEPSV